MTTEPVPFQWVKPTQEQFLVIEHAPWITIDDHTWRKDFTCPRCGHDTVSIATKVHWMVPRTSMTLRCRCTGQHEGRPAGETEGCGLIGEGFTPPLEATP